MPLRTPAGRSAFWRALCASVLALGGAGCGSAQVHKQPAPSPTIRFADVAYPPPTPLPPGPVQLASAPAESDELLLRHPTKTSPRPDRSALSHSMQNAAVRDQVHAELVHSYWTLVETLYRIMPARGNQPDRYDSLPLLRFHAETAADLDTLLLQADALGERWSELAAEQGVDLDGSLDEPSAAGKLRLFIKFSRCVRDDVQARRQHGKRWQVAKAHYSSDAELRGDPPPAVQFAGDMQLLKKTLDCSRYVARVMRGR